MTPPAGAGTERPTIKVLALDWDGTVSCYAEPLGLIARVAQRVVIVTLNDEVSSSIAAAALGIPPARVSVDVCPEERVEDYPQWKVERCRAHGASLVIDDDVLVVRACFQSRIPAICVTELLLG